jgi:hypothetical protein
MLEPTIVLACGASKRDVPASPALELYTGPLFRDARAWALSVAPRGRIWVLSALHGFVHADRRIAPYDHRLAGTHKPDPITAGRASCPRCLAARLNEQLRTQAATDELCLRRPTAAPFCFVGGSRYREALTLASCAVVSLADCLPSGRASRGIGAQRAWLRANHGRLPF